MGHRIVEAIIEDGKLKHVNKKLPAGRIKVHLIYDVAEKIVPETDAKKIVRDTSGIYKDMDIDVDKESRKLRMDWERNA